MNGQDALNLVCQHSSVIGPILAVLLPVGAFSFLSGFKDKMPRWLGHLIDFGALNWPTIVRALGSKTEDKTNA